MCGILGLINVSQTAPPINERTLYDFNKALEIQRHRGPDDGGVCSFCFEDQKSYSKVSALHLDLNYHMDGVIGFNRLSIKDLSMAGHQPMLAVDGKVILVFNGEIYNDEVLRNILLKKGYSFKSTTDTEVIINLYLEYGFEEMVKCLNGMFAILIIDLRFGKIFMARDRLGIKPLYYAFYNGRFVIASELKSIIQFSDFKKELDIRAFNARLVFSRPGDKVLMSGVSLLNPGQAASISCKGEKSFWKYFDLNNYERNEEKYKSFEDAMEEAEQIFDNVVARQMVCDVKVGCQLSGGIDSTLVTYFANKMVGDHLEDTISIIDESGISGEEYYIDCVCNQLGIKNHKFTVDTDYFVNNYEKMIWHNDAPVYKPYFVCHLKLAEKAKDFVTVLLSGEGADELAGGYSRFVAGIYQPFLSKMKISEGHIRSYDSYAEYAVMADTTITDLVSNDWGDSKELIQEQIEVFNSFTGSNFTKHLKFEISQRLPEGLLRQDKMTMAHSIENRVPFLDNEIVDFIMQLPENMLLRFVDMSPLNMSENPFNWASGKYIFKELCARKFGYDFAYRRKAIMVFDERRMYSSSRFREYFYDAVYPKMMRRGLINADYIRSCLDSVNDISNKNLASMWRAIALETWCQLFLDSNN